MLGTAVTIEVVDFLEILCIAKHYASLVELIFNLFLNFYRHCIFFPD